MNTTAWIAVCTTAKLKREKRVLFRHQQLQILLLCVSESFFAIQNKCPHQGYPLDSGFIDPEALNITCPYHHWAFHLKSGKCLQNAAELPHYPIENRDGQIWIQIPC